MNQTSTPKRSSALRRTIAGIAAAGTIAFGGLGMISPSEAAAAGVKTNTYVVRSATVQVQSGASTASTGSTGGTRERN